MNEERPGQVQAALVDGTVGRPAIEARHCGQDGQGIGFDRQRSAGPVPVKFALRGGGKPVGGEASEMKLRREVERAGAPLFAKQGGNLRGICVVELGIDGVDGETAIGVERTGEVEFAAERLAVERIDRKVIGLEGQSGGGVLELHGVEQEGASVEPSLHSGPGVRAAVEALENLLEHLSVLAAEQGGLQFSGAERIDANVEGRRAAVGIGAEQRLRIGAVGAHLAVVDGERSPRNLVLRDRAEGARDLQGSGEERGGEHRVVEAHGAGDEDRGRGVIRVGHGKQPRALNPELKVGGALGCQSIQGGGSETEGFAEQNHSIDGRASSEVHVESIRSEASVERERCGRAHGQGDGRDVERCVGGWRRRGMRLAANIGRSGCGVLGANREAGDQERPGEAGDLQSEIVDGGLTFDGR